MDAGKFIDEFVELKDDTAKKRFIKKHVVNHYMNFETKVSEANAILEKSCYVTEGGIRKYRRNSAIRYMLFVLSVYKNYTDIEIDTTNSLLQFNLLEKNQVFPLIVNEIGADYEQFKIILETAFEDDDANYRSLSGQIDRFENAVVTIADELAKQQEKDDNNGDI